jgi:nucleoside-diphosphate-sugar epimerase
MKILITGATGFVGSHMAYQAHLMGHEVVLSKRSNSKMHLFESVKKWYLNGLNSSLTSDFLSVEQVSQLKLRMGLPQLKNVLAFEGGYSQTAASKIQDFQPQWVEMDLMDTDDILDVLDSSFDAVLHCAAVVSFDKKQEEQMIVENTESTRNLVNACLKKGVKKFLHISSIAALGRPENNQPISIHTDWVESKYNTSYAQSKYLAEMEVWRGKEEGLDVLILNPGVILGFGESKTSSEQVVATVRKGIPAYPAGSNGFVFVDDLVHTALTMLQDESKFGERYLMVSHNLTFQFLMQELADILGVKPPKMELSGWKFQLSYWSIRLVEILGISMPISTELLMSTRRNSVYTEN